MNQTLEAALALADAGYRVMPCVPGAKIPLTPNGLHDATDDTAVVESWWDRWPSANLAVVTNGLIVVDIDVLPDGSPNPWLSTLDPDWLLPLAGCPLSLTPRGGKHFVFLAPTGREFKNTANRIAPNVDTRSTGGYVLVAPSVVNGVPYRWATEPLHDTPAHQLPEPPAWLLEMLEAPAERRASTRTDRASASNTFGEGQRNSALTSLAGTMRRVGMSQSEISAALHRANVERCKPPLDRHDVEVIAASVARYEPDAAAVAAVERGAVRTIERAQPFPVDALPEPVCRFIREAASAIGCDEAYLALPTICCLARAIGNARRIELKPSWSEPSVVWGAVVGKSGTHKSPALETATRCLSKKQNEAYSEHELQMEQFRQELLVYEREIKSWQRSAKPQFMPPEEPRAPICRRYICGDVTIEALVDRLAGQFDGVLVMRDELAGWIGSFDRYAGGKGGDTAHWLACWNAAPLTVDRKTGLQKVIHIPRAAVSIVGGIQPGILRGAIGREHMQDGLCARLLLAMPEARQVQWTEATVSQAVEAELAAVMDRLLSLQPSTDENGIQTPINLPLTPEAKAAWIAFYNRHRGEMAGLGDDLAAAWSKLEAYAARFALIVQLCAWAAGDAGSEVIDQASVEAGIALSDWFGTEARRVYAMLASDDDESADSRELVAWISEQGGAVSARELRRSSRRYREAGKAEEALEELAKSGAGVWEQAPSGPRGGQPARRLCLKTHVRGATTPENTEANPVVVPAPPVENFSDNDEREDRGSSGTAVGATTSTITPPRRKRRRAVSYL